MDRLDKILVSQGIGSRKEVQKLIKKGEVSVNGEICKKIDFKADAEKDEISVSGQALNFSKHLYVMMNKPSGHYRLAEIVEALKGFEGRFVLQTMFLRGVYNAQVVDNTSERELEAWLAVVEHLRPRSVMVYSIDRATPCQTLEKVCREELEKIAERVRALLREI